LANLDTNLKRSSGTQLLLFFLNNPPMPTGVFTALYRQAAARTYAGIAAIYTGANILRQMLMHHGG
jgi:hypothetical protein